MRPIAPKGKAKLGDIIARAYDEASRLSSNPLEIQEIAASAVGELLRAPPNQGVLRRLARAI